MDGPITEGMIVTLLRANRRVEYMDVRMDYDTRKIAETINNWLVPVVATETVGPLGADFERVQDEGRVCDASNRSDAVASTVLDATAQAKAAIATRLSQSLPSRHVPTCPKTRPVVSIDPTE